MLGNCYLQYKLRFHSENCDMFVASKTMYTMFWSFALKQTLYVHHFSVILIFLKTQHVLNSPEQNVQIFSRIWYMIYAFIIVKGIPSPEQDQEKNFHLTCQKLAVEKKEIWKLDTNQERI